MHRRLLVLLSFVLATTAIAPEQALAQRGKTPPDIVGVAFFCGSPGLFQCVGSDAITADADLAGVGIPEGGRGAFLRGSNSELWIGYGKNGHYPLTFNLNLAQLVEPGTCSPSCRLENPIFTISNQVGEFQSDVVGADNETPLPNGLLDVPEGGTRRTKLKISFYDPWGRDLIWGLNFIPSSYADATNINVTRTATCTWVFEPGPGDRAGLFAYGRVGKGKAVRTDEGLYAVPFKFTFSTSTC